MTRAATPPTHTRQPIAARRQVETQFILHEMSRRFDMTDSGQAAIRTLCEDHSGLGHLPNRNKPKAPGDFRVGESITEHPDRMDNRSACIQAERALAAELQQIFTNDTTRRRDAVNLPALWNHCLAVGAGAELVAEWTGQEELAHSAFVTGIFHDIGKIALATLIPKTYARIWRDAQRAHAEISENEWQMIGIDHAALGRRLAVQWRLPGFIVECIAQHHSPESVWDLSEFSRRVLQCVVAANRIAVTQGIGQSGSFIEPRPAEAGDAFLSPAVAEEIGNALLNRMAHHAPLRALWDPRIGPSPHAALRPAAGMGETTRQRPNDEPQKTTASYVPSVGKRRPTDHRDTPGQACIASARRVHILLDGGAAITFAIPVEGRLWRAALFDGNEETGTTTRNGRRSPDRDDVIIMPHESDTLLRATPVRGRRMGRPPGALTPLMSALGQSPEVDWSWWPIDDDGELIGGILAQRPTTNPGFVDDDPESWSEIADSFRQAIVAERARERADRLTDQLLHLQQKVSSQPDPSAGNSSLDMISEMAAGAAHELNNPLAVISGRAQMLARSSGDQSLKDALHLIHSQAVRASGMVSELMHFAKPEPPRQRTIRLDRLVGRVVDEWCRGSSLTKDHVSIIWDHRGAEVRVDPEQFRTIMEAILANAAEATTPADARVRIHSSARPGDEKIVISVQDNGIGMDTAVLKHAFDPFYSYRQAGRGRGMGLARARRLAEINGGTIRLTSIPKRGTTAWIELRGPAKNHAPAQ